ncbi:MAG: N-acetylmuramoyl-L-alanine amidase family protein, partial [Bacilli bacterium]
KAYDKTRSTTFEVPKSESAQNATLKVSEANGSVSLSGSSSGSSHVLYKFSAYDGNRWTVIQDFKNTASTTWKVPKNGTYKFRLFAKDEASSASYDSYVDVTHVVTSVTAPPPSKKLSIVIDPGHGGKDPGAVGVNSLQEKVVVLDVGKRVSKYFAKTPYDIFLTRESDVYLSLAERVSFAASKKADLFISLHTNAANGKASGIETYYYNSNSGRSLAETPSTAAINPFPNESRELATFIQNRLVQAMKLPNRGVKHGNFHVIRENQMPAVLVELGFIDNATDNALLASSTRREEFAKAIYWGTLDYLATKGENVSSYY